jgi:hypothetical protein
MLFRHCIAISALWYRDSYTSFYTVALISLLMFCWCSSLGTCSLFNLSLFLMSIFYFCTTWRIPELTEKQLADLQHDALTLAWTRITSVYVNKHYFRYSSWRNGDDKKWNKMSLFPDCIIIWNEWFNYNVSFKSEIKQHFKIENRVENCTPFYTLSRGLFRKYANPNKTKTKPIKSPTFNWPILFLYTIW